MTVSHFSTKDRGAIKIIERLLQDNQLKCSGKLPAVVHMCTSRGLVVLQDPLNPYKFKIVTECTACTKSCCRYDKSKKWSDSCTSCADFYPSSEYVDKVYKE